MPETGMSKTGTPDTQTLSGTPALSLLPCPFCGGEATMDHDGARRGTRRQSCIVACMDCGCRLESGEEGAMSGRAWNRRASSAPHDNVTQSMPEEPKLMDNSVEDDDLG